MRSAGPGTAVSASLIRVQTFMLTTTATISSISSRGEVLGQRVVEALKRRVRIGVGGAGERIGVAERRLLGL